MPGLTWFRPWMAWAAAVAAMGLLLGLQTVRLADERTEHQTTVSMWAKEREGHERNTRVAVEAARKEEQRRTTAVQEIANETQEKLDSALADADAARDAGERLRKQIAILTASIGRGGSGKPTAAAPGPSTQAAADLLERVQQRLDAAADGIAEFADRAHTAGLGCERSYDALTPPARGLGLKR